MSSNGICFAVMQQPPFLLKLLLPLVLLLLHEYVQVRSDERDGHSAVVLMIAHDLIMWGCMLGVSSSFQLVMLGVSRL